MPSKDVAIYIRGMDRASKAFDKVSRVGGRAFRQLRMAAIGATAAVGAMGVAYGALIQKGVSYNAQMERYQVTLETTMKSQERAVQQLVWAKKFAAETPFEIPEVVEATVRLETYNISAQKTLRSIGNMAAIMGKPLMQAIEAIADAQTGELERLKEFGITKKMLIEEGLKVNTRGQVQDFTQMMSVMTKIMEDRYKGGMDKMSKTFVGVTSNLSDAWGQITGKLGEPIFDLVKKELMTLMKAIDKFTKAGKLDVILKSWGDAGANAFKAIVNVIKTGMPLAIRTIENLGTKLEDFSKKIDEKKIAKVVKHIVDLTSSMAKAVIKVIAFTVENWKLVAALGALVIISKISLLVISFTKTIYGIIVAAKLWAAQNAVLMATLGPVGLAAAITVIIGLLAVFIRRAQNAKKETEAFNRELARENIQRFIRGIETASGKVEAIEKTIKSYQNTISKTRTFLSQVDMGLRKGTLEHDRYNKVLTEGKNTLIRWQAQLEEYKRMLPGLQKELEKQQKFEKKAQEDAKKAAEEKRLKKETRTRVELLTALEQDYTDLVTTEIEKRRSAVETQYADLERRAQGHSDILKLIERNKKIALNQLRADEMNTIRERAQEALEKDKQIAEARISAEKKAWTAIMTLTNNEAALRGAAIKDAYDETLAGTGNIIIAEEVANLTREKFRQDDIKAEEAKVKQFIDMSKKLSDETKVHDRERLERRISNEKDAASEIESIRRDLDSKIGFISGDFFTRELLRIDSMMDRYRRMGVDAAIVEQTRANEFVRIKELEVEKLAQLDYNRIRQSSEHYESFFQRAAELSDILFNAQNQGWLRTFVQLVRFGVQQLAQYMRGLAFEKLKQAAELKTQSKFERYLVIRESKDKTLNLKWKALEISKQAFEASTHAKFLKQHASRMAALASEAVVLASMATAAGRFDKAAQYTIAAIKAGAASAKEFAESVAFEVQAKVLEGKAKVFEGIAKAEETRLQVEARVVDAKAEVQARRLEAEASALMSGAIAVETAGRIATQGLEYAARGADEATKRAEERIKIEQKLRDEILQAQGRGQEVKIKQLEREIEQYRQLGIETSVIDEWERLRRQQELQTTTSSSVLAATGEFGASVIPSSTTPIIVGGTTTNVSKEGIVIYQNNTFEHLIDASKQDDLRELAFLLAPFNEEIERLSRE